MSSDYNNGNFTWWNSTASATTDTLTVSTDTSSTNFSLSNQIIFCDEYYYEWPRGVTDPEIQVKYNPKWHQLQGLKNQMEHMWD